MEPLEVMMMHNLNFYAMSPICHVCNDSGVRLEFSGNVGIGRNIGIGMVYVNCECVGGCKG